MAAAVSIRPVEAGDLPAFFAHQSDPLAARMAGFPSRDHAAFTAHWARVMRDPGAINRTVVADGQVAGNVVCWEQDGQRLVGYWIGREYWGQGVATQALALFLGLVAARPLHAYVAVHNIASRRVLEKCGFRIALPAGDDEWLLVLP